jgi:hypothetical protein
MVDVLMYSGCSRQQVELNEADITAITESGTSNCQRVLNHLQHYHQQHYII